MTQPLIILGMHRSGTSMLTRILAANGLFAGHRLSQHSESLFFHELNVRMLGAMDAEWDRPEPALQMLGEAARVEDLARATRARLSGLRSWKYLGGRSWRAGFHVGPHLPFAWGWKDPRTALFLPVWLRLFPEAKLLRVKRHGIDVAASLIARELGREKPGRCDSIDAAIALWASYESALDAAMRDVPAERQLTISFEDYACNFERMQMRINAFCGLHESAIVPPELAPQSGRIFAYRKDAALKAEADRHAEKLSAFGYAP